MKWARRKNKLEAKPKPKHTKEQAEEIKKIRKEHWERFPDKNYSKKGKENFDKALEALFPPIPKDKIKSGRKPKK